MYGDVSSPTPSSSSGLSSLSCLFWPGRPGGSTARGGGVCVGGGGGGSTGGGGGGVKGRGVGG